MGLLSFLDDVVGLDPGGAGIFGSIGGVLKSVTGQAGQDAALSTSQAEAEEFRRIGALFDPSAELGARQFPALESSATAGGFGTNIGEILQGGSLDPLIAERQRASTSALAGAGLRRSGAAATEAARIPTDLAFQIENELNRRRQGLAQFGQQGLTTQAGLLTQAQESLSGGVMAGQKSRTQGIGNLIGLGSSLIGAFSDPLLKDNIEVIGGINGVDVIRWDWNELALEKYGFTGESTGFDASKVLVSHPHHVTETEDGTLKINYEGLLEELKNGH